jgi:flagellar biosynthesis protein FliP
MQPVLDQAWTTGCCRWPRVRSRNGGPALTAEPFRRFMQANVRGGDLRCSSTWRICRPPATPDDAPWRALMPAFMVSELRRAFEIGFLLFLPFLVIDMVVASVLMSLGMMMLPPVWCRCRSS